MSDILKLKAQVRDRVGKGASRELRRNGMIPAVIYGDKKDPVSIALPRKDMTQLIHAGGFMTTLSEIEVDGEKHRVIPKEYSLDPVRDFLMHIDYLRIAKGAKITVEIPVHFLNEEDCPGLKAGGVLNIVRHTVEVNCPADSIPDSFDIDLLPFEVGESINISSVTLPEGIEPTITDRDFTIATIATPAALRSEEAEEEDGEEASAEVPTIADEEAAAEGDDA